MPEPESDNLDRAWADETLSKSNKEELVSFLSGNPSPTWDLAAYCGEELLEKLFDAAIFGVVREDEEFAVEMVMAVVSGLKSRYRNCEMPDKVSISLVRVIKRACETAQGGDTIIKPSA
jgi:hypothetical protein